MNIQSIKSSIILMRIVEEVKDNVDRICLLMTCKRMYELVSHVNLTNKHDKSPNNTYTLNNFKQKWSRRHLSKLMRVVRPSVERVLAKRLTIESSLAVVPTDVTKLVLSAAFEGTIAQAMIPESVEKLTVPTSSPHALIKGSIPPTLGKLVFQTNYPIDELARGLLPRGLTTLSLPPYSIYSLDASVIPDTVTKLECTYTLSDKPFVLPKSLKYLTLINLSCKQLPVGLIPDSVEDLFLVEDRQYPKPDHLIKDVIPKRLTKFTVEGHRLLFYSLPDTLQTLIYGDSYPGRYNIPLPPALVQLTIGAQFQPHIPSGYLPKTVKTLAVRGVFTCDIDSLPPQLEHLTVMAEIQQQQGPLILPSTLRTYKCMYAKARVSAVLANCEKPERVSVNIHTFVSSQPKKNKNKEEVAAQSPPDLHKVTEVVILDPLTVHQQQFILPRHIESATIVIHASDRYPIPLSWTPIGGGKLSNILLDAGGIKQSIIIRPFDNNQFIIICNDDLSGGILSFNSSNNNNNSNNNSNNNNNLKSSQQQKLEQQSNIYEIGVLKCRINDTCIEFSVNRSILSGEDGLEDDQLSMDEGGVFLAPVSPDLNDTDYHDHIMDEDSDGWVSNNQSSDDEDDNQEDNGNDSNNTDNNQNNTE